MDAKRVRGGLLAAGAAFVAVLVVALLLFFVSGDEADLSYRSVDFDAQLQSNGDIKFTEHLDYQLKRRENDDGDTKPWKQLYLTFKLRNQDLTNITDISVTNASTGEQYTQIAPQLPNDVSDSEWESEYAGHWYIADTTIGSNYPEPFDSATGGLDPNGSDNDKQIEIGWNIPATVKQSSLKFDVTMTFHNMGTQHSDVTNLMWEMFPEDNQVPAGKVTGTVRFPKGIGSDDSWAWLHTEATSQTSRDTDGTLHFTVSDLRTNQYVDLVAAFDNAGASGVERVRSGDYLDELKSILPPEKIVFTGYVYGEKLNQLYTHAGLYVLSSYNEGFPLVLLEAMSYGLDVLVSDIPASHLVDLPADDYFSKGDYEELARKIERKLKYPRQQKYELEAYDWTAIVKRLAAVYDKLNGRKQVP